MISLPFTTEDERTICSYIRIRHEGYQGPVFINIHRLEELHMMASRMIVLAALRKAGKSGGDA